MKPGLYTSSRLPGVFRSAQLTVVLALVSCTSERPVIVESRWSQYGDNPFVVTLDIPPPADSAGGVVTADLDNDGLMDYLVTVRGHIAAYRNDGSRLWVKKASVCIGGSSEQEGLPGHHGPGVQAADIDGDGRTEVLYLTHDGALHVVKGTTGQRRWKANPPVPEGAEHWEHLVIADFRGEGDRDLLLQATNAKGYRVGRYLAAYRLRDLRRSNFRPLWTRDDFAACAHNGARVADLNGDGRDEVLGQMLLSSSGETLQTVPFGGKAHADYVSAADVRPDSPGMEVVLLEEELRSGRRVGGAYLAGNGTTIWQSHHEGQEPQNAAVGEFNPASTGLEIWCRSRHATGQTPFVFDARGNLIASWEMKSVAPEDWTGEDQQLCAAKERHESGDVAIFDALTGTFLHRCKEQADRLYVADVSGDWREELIVLNGNKLSVYHNDDPNPNPDRPRLWSRNEYRRSKMTWNYYSP